MGDFCEAYINEISNNSISFTVNRQFKYEYVELKVLDLNDINCEINGRVIYCMEESSGNFIAEVKLLGTDSENRAFQDLVLQCHNDSINDFKIKIVGFMSQ